MNRGRRGEEIFTGKNDYNAFIVKGSNLLLSLAKFYCIIMLCPDLDGGRTKLTY